MAPRTSFLSRQPDVIASFSFGACTVGTCPEFKGKVCIMTDFQPYLQYFRVEGLSTFQARIYVKKSAGNAP